MANDNLSNLPWEDPDYRAELDRSLMAYGAYLSRTELAVASTSRSLGEFDMPQDWYLLKDENSIQIGRASCWESVCKYVSIAVVAGSINKTRLSMKEHKDCQQLTNAKQ